MKKHLLFSIFIFHSSLFTCYSQATLSGKITNAPGLKVFLALQKGSEAQTLDSTITDASGNFNMMLKQGYRQGVYQFWGHKENPALLIIGSEKKITLTADAPGLKKGELAVVASKENDAFAVLTNFYNLYSAEIDSLSNLLSKIPRFHPQVDTKTKQLKAAKSVATVRYNNSVRLIPNMFSGTFTAQVLCPLYLVSEKSELDAGKKYDTDEAFQHAHFFHYVNFADARIVNTSTYEKKLFTYLDLYAEHTIEGFQQAVDSIMARARDNNEVREFTLAYLLEVFTKKGPPELVEYVHDKYSDGCEIPMKPETGKLLARLKQVSTGSPAPELVINDINYTPLSMKNSLKGKLGMIYFWASTCAHCMEYTPKVFEVYQNYKNKGFEVYSVSLDNDYSAWLKAIQDMKLEWINVSELKGWNSESITTYALERTPSIFLIDKAGNILDKNFAPFELEEKLKKHLQ